MHILVSNDDGVHAKGLQDLCYGLPKEWRITVIAPDRERSGHSHSLTLRTPLCLRKLDSRQDNINFYSFSGTPTDCTKFALDFYLKNDMPDLIISGINKGYNLGSDVLYSGTIGAAMEGLFYGVPALALSARKYNDEQGKEIIPFVADIVQKIFIDGQYKGLVNVNFPPGSTCDWEHTQIVTQGLQRYMDIVSDADIIGEEGEAYYEIKGTLLFEKEDVPTDVALVDEGFIPMTALCWKQVYEEGNVELAKIIAKK